MRHYLKLLIAALALTIINFSCTTNIRGKKLYLLSLSVRTAPMIKEFECNFLSDDKMEVHMTLFAFLGTLKTYKSHPDIYEEGKIHTYTLKDGILEIPDLHLTTKFEKDGDGNYSTSTNEMFYKQSIVDILNTKEARERIEKGSPVPNITPMYLEMIQASSDSQPEVEKRDGKLYLKGSDESIGNSIDPNQTYRFDKNDLISMDDGFRNYASDIINGVVNNVTIDDDGVVRSFYVDISDDNGKREFEVLLDNGPKFGPNMTEQKLDLLKRLLIKGKKVKVGYMWQGTSAGYAKCMSLDFLPD